MCVFLGISLLILKLGYLVAGWLLKPCDKYFSHFFVYFLESVSCISLLLPVACLVAQAGGRRRQEGGRRHKDNLAGKLRPAAQH